MDNDDLENVEASNQESETINDEATPENNATGQDSSSKSQQATSIISSLIRLWKILPVTIKSLIISCLGYIAFFVAVAILILLLGAATAGVAEELKNNSAEIGEKLGNFFTGAGFVTNQEEAEKNEKKYYEKLEEVADYYKKNYNVQIDTTLITATLFYGRGMSDYIDDEDINNIEDNSNDDDIYQGEADFYKLARRQIKTLAKFQIVENVIYNDCVEGEQARSETIPESDKEIADTWSGIIGWNQRTTYNYQPYTTKTHVDVDGNSITIKWCEYHDASAQLGEFYNHDKQIYMDRKTAYENCLNSTALMSCEGVKKVMDDASNFYYKNWIEPGIFDEGGSFSCNSSDTWGDLSNNNGACSAKPSTATNYTTSIQREGVYYYKLLSRNAEFLSNKNFIEKYYPDYVSDTLDDVAMEDAIEVVEGIYDMYDFIKDKVTYAYSSTNLCPNGVTVIAGPNEPYKSNPELFPVGTFNLDEYIAMVLNGENESGGDEAMKAQIIAARTYTLARTNGCTKPIRNSDYDQVAKANPRDHLKELVAETSGMVLTYNGDIFSSEYDNFKATCSGDTCSGVYTKLPLGEKHTVTLPKSAAGHTSGHGRGMSQKAANYMAAQGKTYEEILKYFYSEGVEITTFTGGGSSALPVANGTAQEKLAYLFPSGLPQSSGEMSQYLTDVQIPIVTPSGGNKNVYLTVHQGLQADVINIFTEIANSGFPISDVYCYGWRSMATSSNRSHHSYGVACDINVDSNPMIKNGRVVAGVKWDPYNDPLSITPDGPVVETFERYGWIWGGNWRSSKDYMHFSFTGY